MRPDGTWSGFSKPGGRDVTRRRRALAVSLLALGAALIGAQPAQSTPFAFTGGEQTYTVPPGVASVRITAVGGAGGSPSPGGGLSGGRGAVVSGIVPVTAGQVLFVYVGGSGASPGGGFNGGGAGGTTQSGSHFWGGGGASDVRTVQSSLESRLIVAAGGGGSAGLAAAGGDAGASGGCCGAAGFGPTAAQPGTQSAGGAGGGCATLTVGCGGSGTLGSGGAGAASGTAADERGGGGGGGGLYGGGGGAGHISDSGGGAGGSSLVPSGGTVSVAQSQDIPGSVDIEPYTTTSNSRPGDPTTLLNTMTTQVQFLFTLKRGKTTLRELRLRSVPAGSTVVARCLTRAGTACKGRLTRSNAPSSIRLKPFERRRYKAGTRLVITVTNPAYLTQVKTLTMRKRRGPAARTQCEAPATGGLTAC